MKKILKNISLYFIVVLMLFTVGCKNQGNTENNVTKNAKVNEIVDKNQTSQKSRLNEEEYYYSKEDVAAYIHEFGKLPLNYITKDEAKSKGWSTDNTNGFVIGGNKFGNREGNLPSKSGRKYYEADIADGYGKNRGTQRIIFSNDGLIFYTSDHYETFEQLY